MHPMLVVIRRAPRTLVLLGAVVTAGSVDAEVFKKEDVLRGITISREPRAVHGDPADAVAQRISARLLCSLLYLDCRR